MQHELRVSGNSIGSSIMEHQWRQMRPPQPNICPVCSVSHFPFCPPPPFPPCPPHFPPYHQNPRYPPHPDYPRPEAYHSPLPSSHSANPNDGWQRNHSFDYREGFGQSTCGYNNSNSSNGYIGEADRGNKRPRVDEVGSGVLGNENDQNLGKFSMDNERRLKLIRDHGSALSGNLTNLQYNSNFNASHDRNVDNNNQFEYSKKGQPEGGGAYNRFQNDGIVIYSHLEPNGLNQQAPESQSMPYHEVGFGDVNLPQNQVNWQDHRPPQPYGMPDYRPNYQSPGHRASTMDEPVGYLSRFENRVLSGQPPPPRLPPPLPPSPPPPIPMEPPVRQISEFKSYSSPRKTSLFPVPISSSVANPYMQNKSLSLASSAFYSEEWQTSSLPQHLSPDKPTVVDASQLFKQPYRATRPDHIVIILRGLPGSGKSYLAKMMRDLEIENGGNAPRIHSMDDYFMTEVEKVEESDASKFSSLVRGKKAAVKKVMEYCYEPEMEEAYRDSMLKAFRKTLEEGMFSLIIVDDRNLRVADFAQFWAIAKRSGYEVYISEAAYKDPAGCAARNVHGFTLDEIRNMAQQWEESPTLYLQLDMKSLLHGDDLKESGIQEVDMDTEDGAVDDNLSGLQERKAEKTVHPPLEDDAPQVPSKDGKTWEAEYDHPTGAKELIRSKWSNDLDEDNKEPEGLKENLNALSGLVRAYGKQGKSVCWCDQVGNNGFSIRAAKKVNTMSLVIGPGAGYNLKSNPIPEEESPISTHRSESRRQSVFQEQLRAERESFKAVFEKRRRRIGGLNLEEQT